MITSTRFPRLSLMASGLASIDRLTSCLLYPLAIGHSTLTVADEAAVDRGSGRVTKQPERLGLVLATIRGSGRIVSEIRKIFHLFQIRPTALFAWRGSGRLGADENLPSRVQAYTPKMA